MNIVKGQLAQENYKKQCKTDNMNSEHFSLVYKVGLKLSIQEPVTYKWKWTLQLYRQPGTYELYIYKGPHKTN